MILSIDTYNKVGMVLTINILYRYTTYPYTCPYNTMKIVPCYNHHV